MAELDDRDLLRLIEYFNQSDIGFLHFKTEALELMLTRDSLPQSASLSQFPTEAPSDWRNSQPSVAAAAQVTAVQTTDEFSGRVTLSLEDVRQDDRETTGLESGFSAERLMVITAPTVGVFFRSPRPDLAPYVDVGSRVEVGMTVGLIEAMKVFTGVSAESVGEVVEILVSNEEFVQYGQPLLRILVDD